MAHLSATRALASLIACAALLLLAAEAPAQAPRTDATEASIKAAFLCKFPAFVDWTADAFAQPDAPLVIGVMGSDEVAAELQRLVPGRAVNGHPLNARRLREGESLKGVHILFVGRAEAPRVAAIARAAQAMRILVVAESERALESGAVINFVLAEDRVGFEVSLESAERSGLRISSRMLAVARRVVPGELVMRGPIARSLRRKVMVLVLATTFSALALSALGLVLIDLRNYERQWTNDLTTLSEVVARASAPALAFEDPKAAAGDLLLLKAQPAVLGAAIYAANGKPFATYAKEGTAPLIPPLPGAMGVRIDEDQLQVFHPIVEKGEALGTVYLVASYRPWERLRDYLDIIGVVMAVSLVIAALMTGWLQSAVTGPILMVTRVAREVVTQRDYSLRVPKSTEDEIGELVESFNAMLAEAGRRAEQLRSAAEQLQEADRRKDEFLATLAHELRNPLAPIRNAVEILRLAGSDPAANRNALMIMERQLAQMVRLVDDLLDVSRITTGKLTIHKSVVELGAIVQDALETTRPFIEKQGHALEIDIAPDPLPVVADRTRLAQVFANLLHNAAKYTERGGRIQLSATREGAQAVIRVRDNGIGIAPAILESIFEMFVQADRSLERPQAGLGVGLSLAKRLVQLHDGSIVARSDGLGRGSEFEVRVPLASAGAAAGEKAAASPAPQAARRRVLLADDNVDFADSLASLLVAAGHDVRVAHDGAQALEFASTFLPELAFLDIGMPRVNGYDVARHIRERPETAHCFLVAVTGWGQADDLRRAREAGFDRHLVKPVEPGTIEAILEGT